MQVAGCRRYSANSIPLGGGLAAGCRRALVKDDLRVAVPLEPYAADEKRARQRLPLERRLHVETIGQQRGIGGERAELDCVLRANGAPVTKTVTVAPISVVFDGMNILGGFCRDA